MPVKGFTYGFFQVRSQNIECLMHLHNPFIGGRSRDGGLFQFNPLRVSASLQPQLPPRIFNQG